MNMVQHFIVCSSVCVRVCFYCLNSYFAINFSFNLKPEVSSLLKDFQTGAHNQKGHKRRTLVYRENQRVIYIYIYSDINTTPTSISTAITTTASSVEFTPLFFVKANRKWKFCYKFNLYGTAAENARK